MVPAIRRQALYVLFLLLLFTSTSFAQSKAGYRALKKQDYQAALEAFKDGIWDMKDKPASLLGIAQLYADSNFYRYSLDSAYLYAGKAELAFSDMPYDIKRKVRKKFRISEVNSLKKEVERLSYEAALQADRIPVYNDFLEKYPRSPYRYRNTVETQRNQLAFEQAQAQGDWQAYRDLLDRYGASMKTKNPGLYRKAQTAHFKGYISEYSWSGYPAFAGRNPDNLFVLDSLTKFAFDKVRKTNDFLTYRRFYGMHTESPYADYARDSMFSIATRYGDLKDFSYLLNTFPQQKPEAAFWKSFYEQYKLENPTEEGLAAFSEQYPQFPFPEWLEADLAPLRREQVEKTFADLRASTELQDYYAFLENYPNAPQYPQAEAWTIDRLLDLNIGPFYASFLDRFPNSEHRQTILQAYYDRLLLDDNPVLLQQFARKYPAFEGMDRLEKDVALLQRAVDFRWTEYAPDRKEVFARFIREAAPSEIAFKALWQMVKRPIQQQNWSLALNIAQAFEVDFDANNMHYNQLLHMLRAPARNVEVQSVSSRINTPDEEYEAVISADGMSLYFTGRNRPDNMGGEDIFVSRKENNEWTIAKLVESLSSPMGHESAEALSVDGNSMLVFKSGKICYSQKTSQGWTEPEPLPPVINRYDWQADARLSADGRALLFSARKPNDDIDIYVSLKAPDGSWGIPVNLGPTINTIGTDRSPFLHPDMKTLYFSSIGHVSVGNLDVFKTTRLDNSWTNWSEPVNIGREINTPDHDWGYRISTDGKTAFFSFSNGEHQDVGMVELPEDVRPEEVSTIAGQVVSRQGEPLEAEIIWRDLETDEILQTVRSDPQTGAFFVTFPENSRFGYSARKTGYFPENGSVDLSDGHADLELKIVLASIDEMLAGRLALPINNLFFETGEYEIQKASYADLNLLAEVIRENDLTVEILGHTDNVGDPQANLQLSQNRADATREYLISRGCDPQKIITRGYGEQRPLQSNESSGGRAQNRRVEIRLVQ